MAPVLSDPKVVEIMLNADGRIWVDRLGGGMSVTDARMGPAAAERMLRLVASEMGVELNAAAPSLAAKLPPPYSARLQASIPPSSTRRPSPCESRPTLSSPSPTPSRERRDECVTDLRAGCRPCRR